ncbi:MAG: outer membrane beta-barrel protein [Myxococcota bacterium]
MIRWFAFVAVLVAASSGHAQVTSQRAIFGVELGVFDYTSVSFEGRVPGVSRTRLSVLSQGAGIRAGYAPGRHVAILATAFLDREKLTSEDDSSELSETFLQWRVGPRLEFRIGAERSVRPFIRTGVFFAGERAKDDSRFSEDVTRRYFGIEAAAGLHLFVTERLSFDPALSFTWRRQLGGDEGARFRQFGLSVGMTGWFGSGSPTEVTTRPQRREAMAPARSNRPPRVEYAELGGRRLAARFVTETSDARIQLTYDSTVARGTGSLAFVSRATGDTVGCDVAVVSANSQMQRFPIRDRQAAIGMGYLQQSLSVPGTLVQFCGFRWRPVARDRELLAEFFEASAEIFRATAEPAAENVPPSGVQPTAAVPAENGAPAQALEEAPALPQAGSVPQATVDGEEAPAPSTPATASP